MNILLLVLFHIFLDRTSYYGCRRGVYVANNNGHPAAGYGAYQPNAHFGARCTADACRTGRSLWVVGEDWENIEIEGPGGIGCLGLGSNSGDDESRSCDNRLRRN